MGNNNMTDIGPHAEWLRPHLDLEKGLIRLIHNTGRPVDPKMIDDIRIRGLRLPSTHSYRRASEGDEDAIYCAVATYNQPQGLWPYGIRISFQHPIGRVNIRPAVLSAYPKYVVPKKGIPLKEYLERPPPEVWNLVAEYEFLIFEDIPPEMLNFEQCLHPPKIFFKEEY